jgi:hypothetical protein
VNEPGGPNAYLAPRSAPQKGATAAAAAVPFLQNPTVWAIGGGLLIVVVVIAAMRR